MQSLKYVNTPFQPTAQINPSQSIQSFNPQILNDSSDLENNFYTNINKKQTNIIVDSADLRYDYQLKLLSSHNPFPILKEIDPFILSKIKTHKTIASFFKQINFYWMVIYAILLIINLLFYIQLSFILHCHYINKELANNGVFYIINSFIFNSILFIDSVVAIYNFLKGQPIYNCLSEFNIQIEFAFILLLISLWMRDLLINQTYLAFLKETTFSSTFDNWFIILLLIILIINFKMKSFFEEYIRYIPIKYDLIPNEGIIQIQETIEVI
jgi:hypothetical protein